MSIIKGTHSIERRCLDAVERFTAAVTIDPRDGPSLLDVARCTDLAEDPPPAVWDGVYVLKYKEQPFRFGRRRRMVVDNGWNLQRRGYLEERLRADPRRATVVLEVDLDWQRGAVVALQNRSESPAFDLPTWAGGTERASSPVEAVLAALGAEIAGELSLLAAQAGATIESLSLHVEGGVDLARVAGITPKRPIIDEVQVEVALTTAEPLPNAAEVLHRAVGRSAIAGLFAAAGEPVTVTLVDSSLAD